MSDRVVIKRLKLELRITERSTQAKLTRDIIRWFNENPFPENWTVATDEFHLCTLKKESQNIYGGLIDD